MKTPPKVQVDTMSAGVYFAYGSQSCSLHAPHVTDEPIIAQMKKMVSSPARASTSAKLDPAVQKAAGDRAAGRARS